MLRGLSPSWHGFFLSIKSGSELFAWAPMRVRLNFKAMRVTRLLPLLSRTAQIVLFHSENTPKVTAASCYPSADNSSTERTKTESGQSRIQGQPRRRRKPEANRSSWRDVTARTLRVCSPLDRKHGLVACASGDRQGRQCANTSRSQTGFALSGLIEAAMRSQAPV